MFDITFYDVDGEMFDIGNVTKIEDLGYDDGMTVKVTYSDGNTDTFRCISSFDVV